MSKRRVSAEDHIRVSLDLATVCEAPFERALTLLALAELRVATSQFGEAGDLLADVRTICGPLGAAPVLARARALTSSLTSAMSTSLRAGGLTPRELDVLRLLPRGLSNAEIAESLFVSPRTVQTHLTNLYTKLGVGGRAEAIAHALTHDLI